MIQMNKNQLPYFNVIVTFRTSHSRLSTCSFSWQQQLSCALLLPAPAVSVSLAMELVVEVCPHDVSLETTDELEKFTFWVSGMQSIVAM